MMAIESPWFGSPRFTAAQGAGLTFLSLTHMFFLKGYLELAGAISFTAIRQGYFSHLTG